MGWLAALALVGTGIKAYGQYKSAQDAATTYDLNADIARSEGAYAKEAARKEIASKRKEKGRFVGTQRAQYGKAGVLFEGSPAEVIADTIEQYELDILKLQFNANIAQSRAESKAYGLERQAKTSRTSGALQAVGTLLGGASRFSGGAASAYSVGGDYALPANYSVTGKV